MDQTVIKVWQMAESVARKEGLEIIDIELRSEGRRSGRVLRLYLDKDGGPNIDELSRVSQRLSELLDQNDVVEGAYNLEVSSPGINRPLQRPEHFKRFIGKRVRVRTRELINGRRAFLGPLLAADDESVAIDQDGTRFDIPIALIERSNYEHDWST